MTDKEIQQQIDRAGQDAITLDYTKWSFQQRMSKRSDDHGLWQQERDGVLDRQRSDNAITRARYLQDLEDKKREKQRTGDAEIELSLAPEKSRLQNAWLADHPHDTPEDFERKAWQHLKANLIEQRKGEAMNAEINALTSTGRYSL